MNPASLQAERQWHSKASLLAGRMNALLLLDAAGPLMVAALLLGAVASLLVRTQGGPVNLPALLAGCLALIALLWGAHRARGKFWSVRDAMTRLEIANGLEARLTAAGAGLTPWPKPEAAQDGYGARLHRLAGPLLVGTLLWTAAAWIPLPSRSQQGTPTVEPLAWQQTEALLESLEEVEEIEPESLASFEEALEQLRSRPPEEWYAHSSLEAGESLLANLQDSARRMAESLAAADDALGQAGGDPSQASDAALEQAASDMREALRGMDASKLNLGADLKQALANAGSPTGLRQLSLDQLQKIQIKVLKACEGTGQCAGLGSNFGRQKKEGEGEGAGRGGVTRGPGTAPLSITDRNPLEEAGIEGAVASDIGNEAGVGDVVGTRLTAPETNEQPFNTQAGGTAVIEAGAEAVNRQATTPAERAVLQRYFQ